MLKYATSVYFKEGNVTAEGGVFEMFPEYARPSWQF
jgi:hypothetical protein